MKYLHSGMTGAPAISNTNRSFPDMLAACLVNGFNVQAPTSATASGGVLTLNYSSAHGYAPLVDIEISGASVGAANGVHRAATVPAGNQLTCVIDGLPDGAVGGTISTKVAPLGWSEPFAASTTTRVFRQGGGAQRYVRADYSTFTALATMRAFMAMTGLDTGTGDFPTVAQTADGVVSLSPAFSAVVSWSVVGDDKGFYWTVAGVSDQRATAAGFFGDLVEPVKPADAYATLLASTGSTNAAAFLARDHTGASGSVAATINLFPNATLSNPSPINSATMFHYGVAVFSAGAVRGLLPGAFTALPSLSQAVSTLDGVQGIAGRVKGQGWQATSSSLTPLALAIDE
jgi:hypothetical protein